MLEKALIGCSWWGKVQVVLQWQLCLNFANIGQSWRSSPIVVKKWSLIFLVHFSDAHFLELNFERWKGSKGSIKMRLNPSKIEFPRKRWSWTRFSKLDNWVKAKMYPNRETYRGAFDGKKNQNFCRPQVHFEQLYQKISDTQDMNVTKPSPIHLVWRHQPFYCRPWWEKIALRKLGLHYQYDHERVLIPNTPHYNRLLWEVKHLIKIKPLTFPDGVPTEKDIGATRVCTHFGTVRIGDQYRVSDDRLNGETKPVVYQGVYLRDYLKRLIGIFPRHHE